MTPNLRSMLKRAAGWTVVIYAVSLAAIQFGTEGGLATLTVRDFALLLVMIFGVMTILDLFGLLAINPRTTAKD